MTAPRILGLALVAACGGGPPAAFPGGGHDGTAQLSLAADAQLVTVPAGRYIAGSTPEERQAAYDDYLATAHADTARARKWFEGEDDRHAAELPAFRIDLLPVTQAAYAEFVATGGAPPPAIDEAAWRVQGFQQDYATEVVRFVWRDGRPPSGRADHPVVLVTRDEAQRYCAWRGQLAGSPRRLPTGAEYEKAARGEEGLAYPWGNTFEPDKLNSGVDGPRDTTPVGQHVAGASPFGVLELAGNVFAWTASSMPDGRAMVKGSAWEDFAGVGRGASRHGRPVGARHVIVGFRCAADAP